MNPDCSTFHEYPKTPRLFRDVITTEKIDGSNAQVVIWDELQSEAVGDGITRAVNAPAPADVPWLWSEEGLHVAAGSRQRWITPESDNFGFANWVQAHAEQLVALGPGRHFGEWWGSGIQRGYDCAPGERHFSLFNVARWDEEVWSDNENARVVREQEKLFRAKRRAGEWPAGQLPWVPRNTFVAPPSCCEVVPVLYSGPFSHTAIAQALQDLRDTGSYAKEGFMRPEGIVVFHTAANHPFKVLIENDDKAKGNL